MCQAYTKLESKIDSSKVHVLQNIPVSNELEYFVKMKASRKSSPPKYYWEGPA